MKSPMKDTATPLFPAQPTGPGQLPEDPVGYIPAAWPVLRPLAPERASGDGWMAVNNIIFYTSVNV